MDVKDCIFLCAIILYIIVDNIDASIPNCKLVVCFDSFINFSFAKKVQARTHSHTHANTLCLCARLFICTLWSPAGKGLASWLSFVHGI